MFDRLKQWIGDNAESNTGKATEALSAATFTSLPLSNPSSPVSTLDDVAKVFANSLLRAPNSSGERARVNAMEMAIYDNVLKMLKDGEIPDNLPKCPAIITEIMQVVKRDDATYKDITALINKEPVLASNLIKLANSPLFRSGSGELTNVEHAAQRLGMGKISALASTILMQQIMEIRPIYFKMFGKYLWAHSQQCALACGYLAKKSGEDYFTAYLIGLLHDIGKLVIFQELVSALRSAHPDIHPSEKVIASIVDRTATKLSCMSLKYWDLPKTIQKAVCEQKKNGAEESYSPMGYILFSANVLSEIWLLLEEQIISKDEATLFLQQHDLSFDLLEEIFGNIGKSNSAVA